MKYIYDKSGKYIDFVQTDDIEMIQKQYPDTFVLNNYIGEIGIIENGQIREKIRFDRIKLNEEELKEGEYIKGNEIITVEKPDVFYTWDNKKWIYNKDLEIDFINSEILNKETELNDLYDTLDKATARRLKALIADTQHKIDKIIEELETLENKLKELEG